MRTTVQYLVFLVGLLAACTGTFDSPSTAPGSGDDGSSGGDSVVAGDFEAAGDSATSGDSVVAGDAHSAGDSSPPGLVQECQSPRAEWIWCDDFEVDRMDSYFERSLPRAAGVGLDGSMGTRNVYSTSSSEAGYLKVAFGRTPTGYFAPVDAGTEDYREIYWRMFLRNEPDWIGGGAAKLSRATSMVSSDWSQSMIAHVWSGGANTEYLNLDPASGTDASGNIIVSGYNDFDNLRWLGNSPAGTTPLFSGARVGEWFCVEAHVRLNDSGSSNGTFELWINGNLETTRTNLNWVGSYDDYGINVVMFENYWNATSPVVQERYFDNLVVSTARIGCGG